MAGDTIAQVKERLNIVDVVSGYLKLQKSGINFKAQCPFHNEKTASFYVSPERQIWHCFGCQKGGDMFSFIKEIEGVEFGEALRTLAQRAGVKIEQYDSSIKDERVGLFEICEAATKFFEKQLYQSPVGKNALAYLKTRGLTDATIKEFRLGFAPDAWHSLGNFLRDFGYNDRDIINSGLVIKKEGAGDMYDRFRSRIIFPIANINGQIVGFTGRIFEHMLDVPEFPGHRAPDPGAKYINTPQTAIYDKSRILYGLSRAKTEARRQNCCLLVEGNMDAIMSYQAGVKNTVATSGTALTPSHLQLLQRYTNNLDFCFDIDQAGLVATRRGIGLALSQNFNIKIVHLNDPECKDPADYVKKFGNKWNELVRTAKPVLEFYFDKLRTELDIASVDGKKAIITSLGPLIKRLSSQVERSHWVSKLAAILKTKEEAIEADLLSVKDDLDVYTGTGEDNKQKSSIRKAEPQSDVLLEALLAVILKNPTLFSKELNGFKNENLDARMIAIIEKLKEMGTDKFEFDKFIENMSEKDRMDLEVAQLKAQEFLKEFSDEELLAEFKNIKNKIEQRSISAKLASLELDINVAEAGNNKTDLKLLLNEFSELTKDLKKI